MELNGLRWFSILGNLHVCSVSMTWLWSKLMKNHSNGNKDSSKERNETPRQQQRKTQLLFLDLGRLSYLQAWGADRTASLPCHPRGQAVLEWAWAKVVLLHVTGQSQGQLRTEWIAKIWSHFGMSYEGWRNDRTRLSAHLLPWGQELFPPNLTGMWCHQVDLLLSLASAEGLAGSGTCSYMLFLPFLTFCS